MRALDMWTHPSATRMPIPMEVRPKRNWSGACHTSFNMTLGFLGWDGKGFWKGKVNKFNPNDCFQVATVDCFLEGADPDLGSGLLCKVVGTSMEPVVGLFLRITSNADRSRGQHSTGTDSKGEAEKETCTLHCKMEVNW